MDTYRDASSNSNYNSWTTIHTTLDWNCDFDQSILDGSVTLQLQNRKDASPIILDTSYLDIKKVQIDGVEAVYNIEKRREPLGSPLIISVPRSAETVSLKIYYATTSKCTALQWLQPSQTAGTKHYLFSQCQAIHARSMLPCQDTPLIKSPMTFNIRSPYPVVATGLFKGATRFDKGSLVYTYDQPIPIPSYLAAIASGDLATAQIGPRSLLYTEPKYIASAQREMESVIEQFIKTAESFLPKYVWSTFNVLILPQSFPYGGMENPNITFATPTILAGDGSNLDVIAHELSHSWSGNLITCAGWSHFWLNEGWTVFLERKIISKIHGPEYGEFSAIIGWKALEQSVDGYGPMHEYTKLVQNLDGKDPDDAFSSVPYEKGFNLLYHIQATLGGSTVFEPFIMFYFTKFARLVVTSLQFKASLYEFFTSKSQREALDSIDWETWFYGPGLPPRPAFDTTLANACYDLSKRWQTASPPPFSSSSSSSSSSPSSSSTTRSSGGFEERDVAGWSAGQFIVFLESLSSASSFTSPTLLKEMATLYHLPTFHNAEILFRYFTLVIKCKLSSQYPAIATWLGTVGRMKFVRPLFRGLESVDRELAIRTFEKVGGGLHPICREMVRKDLKL